MGESKASQSAFWFYTTFKKKALLLNVLETESLRAWPKLYIPRTLNTDLILWHTQLIVSAENENIQTSVHLEVLNSHMLWAKHLIRQCWKHPNFCSSGGFKWSCNLSRKSHWVIGKHPNICSSAGFEQSYALSKISY